MKSISAEEFDRRFEAGEDLDEYIDYEHPIVHKAKAPRVMVTPSGWLLDFYDREAERRSMSRKAVMHTALVEWADEQMRREAELKAIA